jgi:putative endopeptidase
VLPGAKINGKLTLGENIADAGGIKLAFRAYRNMRKDAPDEQVADGYTEDQQFFLATGQIWCAEYREEAAKLQVQTDPHAHPRYRVNGPLSHLPEFAQAFSCKAGSKMVAPNACQVW